MIRPLAAAAIAAAACAVPPPRPARAPTPPSPRPPIEARRGHPAVVAAPGLMERRLIALVNRDRRRRGLAPLAIDEGVVAVARAHSQEMLDAGYVAHRSPTTGSAYDRIRAAGIRSAVVLENITLHDSVAAAHRALMDSPGHRANILSPRVTRVGVGVVLRGDQLLVTEVFTRGRRPIDPEAATAELARRIRAARPLRVDDSLAAIARGFARDLARGSSVAAALSRAHGRLDDLPTHYAGIAIRAEILAEVDDFDAAAALAGRSVTRFGAGVAQGDHPEIGDGAVFIAVLFARR